MCIRDRASGMALTGKVPFAGSFAEFVTGRVYDQIRMEVCYGCLLYTSRCV